MRATANAPPAEAATTLLRYHLRAPDPREIEAQRVANPAVFFTQTLMQPQRGPRPHVPLTLSDCDGREDIALYLDAQKRLANAPRRPPANTTTQQPSLQVER